MRRHELLTAAPMLLVHAALLAAVSGCIPAEDANPKVYGSVEFDLAVTKAQVTDFSDGWTFSVEHVLVSPFCTLEGYSGYGADPGTCSNIQDDGDGRTIVDLVAGAAFDINAVVPDGHCTSLSVSGGGLFSGEAPLVAPGIPREDVAAFLATADAHGAAGVLLVGSAQKNGVTKRVSLGLGNDVAAIFAGCTPTKAGEPVPLGIANTRQHFHFDFDVEQFFPGSPPAFGRLADADTNPTTGNDDGVVTWDEVARAGLLTEIIDGQLNRAWGLRSSDGTCPSPDGDGGTPNPLGH